MVSTFRRVNLHIAHLIIERQSMQEPACSRDRQAISYSCMLRLFVYVHDRSNVCVSFVRRWCLFLVGYIIIIVPVWDNNKRNKDEKKQATNRNGCLELFHIYIYIYIYYMDTYAHPHTHSSGLNRRTVPCNCFVVGFIIPIVSRRVFFLRFLIVLS